MDSLNPKSIFSMKRIRNDWNSGKYFKQIHILYPYQPLVSIWLYPPDSDNAVKIFVKNSHHINAFCNHVYLYSLHLIICQSVVAAMQRYRGRHGNFFESLSYLRNNSIAIIFLYFSQGAQQHCHCAFLRISNVVLPSHFVFAMYPPNSRIHFDVLISWCHEKAKCTHYH